jgi:hypothetical protein
MHEYFLDRIKKAQKYDDKRIELYLEYSKVFDIFIETTKIPYAPSRTISMNSIIKISTFSELVNNIFENYFYQTHQDLNDYLLRFIILIYIVQIRKVSDRLHEIIKDHEITEITSDTVYFFDLSKFIKSHLEYWVMSYCKNEDLFSNILFIPFPFTSFPPIINGAENAKNIHNVKNLLKFIETLLEIKSDMICRLNIFVSDIARARYSTDTAIAEYIAIDFLSFMIEFWKKQMKKKYSQDTNQHIEQVQNKNVNHIAKDQQIENSNQIKNF